MDRGIRFAFRIEVTWNGILEKVTVLFMIYYCKINTNDYFIESSCLGMQL